MTNSALALSVSAGLFSWGCFAFAVEPTWRKADEVRQELHNRAEVSWSTTRSLRDALSNLSASQRVAIWLDRRIDPSLEHEFSFEKSSLQVILQQVAKRLGCEVGFIGPVVYIGPPSVATRLWTVAELRHEEVRRLPPALRGKWTQQAPAQWPELSTPRELLQSAADEAGCKLEGLEAIPHDLWAAAQLPPMTLAERMTLILAGFDRTFEVAPTGQLIRLTALPDRPTLQREYAPRGEVSRNVSELSKRFPQATVHRAGARLAVQGTAEEHDAISRLLRGEPDRRVPTGPPETRYTMTVTNKELGYVLRTLNVKAQLQVAIDDNAKDKLYELVSFDVKDATLDQLLQAAMRGTGLKYQLQGLQLRVSLDR